MQSNADNIYVKNTTDAGAPDVNYTNGRMGGVRGTNPYTYHVAEPLVTTLKNLGDPRLKFMVAYYSPLQSTAPNVTNPDTISSHQFGFPVGYQVGGNWKSTSPGYRAPTGTGESFSQLNYNVVANSTTPSVIISNAQTKFADSLKILKASPMTGDLNGTIILFSALIASILVIFYEKTFITTTLSLFYARFLYWKFIIIMFFKWKDENDCMFKKSARNCCDKGEISKLVFLAKIRIRIRVWE